MNTITPSEVIKCIDLAGQHLIAMGAGCVSETAILELASKYIALANKR